MVMMMILTLRRYRPYHTGLYMFQLESEESIGSDVEPDRQPYENQTITEDDEVFPYDDNIPSIPSIPTLCEPVKNGPVPAYRRRNLLLRMISDPKCYNPRVLKSLSHEKRHRSETAKQFFRTGAHGKPDGEDPAQVSVNGESSCNGSTSSQS